MAAIRLVRNLPRPDPSLGFPVVTDVFGEGRAILTEKGLHVSWDRVRLPEMRRGDAVVDARVGLDADAAFTPLLVEIRYASGAPAEDAALNALRQVLAPTLRGECLSAGSVALAVRPEETVAALRAASPDLDDADISGAVDRVIERLDANPRLMALADEEGPTLRENLESLARSLRPPAPGW